jgi:hypothetical protein
MCECDNIFLKGLKLKLTYLEKLKICLSLNNMYKIK